MKKKIEPAHLFLVFVACLPFVAVWVGRRQKETPEYQRVALDWISVELPGTVQQVQRNPQTGMRFITASATDCFAVVALVPAPAQSELAQAYAAGAPAVAEAFQRLFPSQALEGVECDLELPRKTYRLTGRRQSDQWGVAGHMGIIHVQPAPVALVVLAAAVRPRKAIETAQRVLDSVGVKPEVLSDLDLDDARQPPVEESQVPAQ